MDKCVKKDENPWKQLMKNENNEYIAECDINQINTIRNRIANYPPSKQLNLEYIPQPYVGDPFNSIIYFLLSNPSPLGTYSQDMESIAKNNLIHENIEYPLFWINPKYGETEAYNWWYNKLQHLINISRSEIISKKIFAIDYMAYFSEKYPYIPETHNIPSQNYSIYLIKKAMEVNKIIIIGRFRREWYNKIPELENYRYSIEIINRRNPIISPNNIQNNNFGIGFDEIVNKMRNL